MWYEIKEQVGGIDELNISIFFLWKMFLVKKERNCVDSL